MGVRGFTSYLGSKSKKLPPVTTVETGTTLVVDGSGLAFYVLSELVRFRVILCSHV